MDKTRELVRWAAQYRAKQQGLWVDIWGEFAGQRVRELLHQHPHQQDQPRARQ